MDHSTYELREMLRGMDVKFSDKDTYEELKELFHKENHRRWMGMGAKGPDGTRISGRTRRLIRRRKDSPTKIPGADTRPPARSENDPLRAAPATGSIPKAVGKRTFRLGRKPFMKRDLAVTKKRQSPPLDAIIPPERHKIMVIVPERDILKSVMRRACNSCERCGDADTPNQAPFYLTPLASGGTEAVKNIVILCPECLLKMQASDNPNEYKLLKRKARSRIPSTIEYHRR